MLDLRVGWHRERTLGRLAREENSTTLGDIMKFWSSLPKQLKNFHDYIKGTHEDVYSGVLVDDEGNEVGEFEIEASGKFILKSNVNLLEGDV